MGALEITRGIHWVGAVDWERHVFDALLPSPEGTTYNAYLVRGSAATALVDTVDPAFTSVLLDQLDELGASVDYVVTNHAEQDHSGSLPAVLARYAGARVVATQKCRDLVGELLGVAAKRVTVVEDGDTLSLGDRTLRFVHFPWVHWPETMVTFVEEDAVLFPGDLFGAHLAVSDVRAAYPDRIMDAARRYYGLVMMPFRGVIGRNLPRIEALAPRLIAPAHGPLVTDPVAMLDTYRAWVGDQPENLAVVPYVSMHDSTRRMVMRLADALVARGVRVDLVPLESLDIGRLSAALVDAATVVFGSPTVLGGAHPQVAYAALLANALRPKARHASIVGSYGWGGKMAEQLAQLTSGLRLEMLEPVIVRGAPGADDFAALERLADEIAAKHRVLFAETPPATVSPELVRTGPGRTAGTSARASSAARTPGRASRGTL
jgi:flavorubredoxin